ncbi:MAG TPA: hypothetical protein VLT91_14550 [Rhizomicrobium sp.]|nr:hypothetical protein [Rhizomicrobium sp.]
MKKLFLTAALAMTLLGTAAHAQMVGRKVDEDSQKSDAKPAKGHVTPAVGAALNAAQKALQAKDTATAMTQIKAAQAVPNRTPFDDFNINRFLSAVAANTGDYQTSATAFEAVIASPSFADLTPDEQAATYHDATVVEQNVSRWPQVIDYGQKFSATGKADDLIMTMLAIAYFKTNDNADAKKYAQMAVDAAKAAGKEPQPNALIILGNIEGKTDPDAARRAIESMILSSNNPDDWSKLIDDGLSHKGTKPVDALFLYRLRYQLGAMRSDDYPVLGQLAAQLHLDKEAATVLDQGISSGKITSAQAGPTLSTSRNLAAKDAGVLSAVANAANSSKTGQAALALAQDYWGYGRYADSEAMARLALSKGGLKDPGEATVLLGSALAVEGKYPEAQTTLASVSGSEARGRAAHLWSLYAEVKSKGTAAH